MLSNYVMPGDPVEMLPVSVKNAAESVEEPKKVYKSQVYDLISEERMELTMPMEKAKLVLLPIDGEYTIYFYTAGGIYQCTARIVERYKTGNIYILVLDLTSNLSKRQRREFYRYDCAVGMLLRRMEPEEAEAAHRNRKLILPGLSMDKAVIVDISGGGLRYVSDVLYEPDSMLYFKFVLSDAFGSREYQMAGRLLRIRELENKKGYYEGHVQYLMMDEKEREEIIKFIFEEERKQRKREKG